jgi:putative ABC transport system permease protein
VSSFFADLGFAFRILRKSPLFFATVVFVLALGIGANSAVFSVVDAVLLHALPYRQPDRLVMLWEKNPTLGAFVGDRVPAAYSNFIEWRKRATKFAAIAGFADANFNLTSAPEPERISGARASANFFETLGVQPRLGTSLAAAATDPSRTQVVLLSDTFFKNHFGGQPNVLGQKLTLNDLAYTIVGVLPPDFHLPASRDGSEQRKPDLWVPFTPADNSDPIEFNRRKMQVYGRLADGVTLTQARAEMAAIAQQLAEENPTVDAGFAANVFPIYVEDVGQELKRNLTVLLAAVGFVLLIACANIASLMLSRAAIREREMAIRKALGAGRARLISQLLAEGLVLSGIGATLGLLFAQLAITLFVAMKPAGINRPEEIHLSLAVLLFTTGVAIGTAVLFGIAPALQAARADVNAALRHTSGWRATAPSGRLRHLLIVAEVALASVLLIGATFMMKSLVAVMDVDPGFRPDHLLTMKFSMPPSRYPSNATIAGFCRQALEKIAALPGVKSASFSDGLPLTRIRLTKFTVDGQPEPKRGSEPTADLRGIVNPDYFHTIGLRLIEGRNFTADELNNRRPLVIVNQALAQKLWPNESAVGQHLRSVPSKTKPVPTVSTVIGVVANTHQLSLEEGTRPEITKPMVDYTQLTLAVRTALDPDSLVRPVKEAIWSIDRALPVFELQTMQQVIDDSTSQRRFDAFLMGTFGFLALILAAVGIYGVLSSLVAQRTQEIGIRIALGAQIRDVMVMILSQGVRMVALGLLIGIAAGFALSRFLASLFFGVSATSPVTYGEVALLLLGTAAFACLLPALRATRVNPIDALRYE